MWKLFICFSTFLIFGFTFATDSNNKCTVWFTNPTLPYKCCNLIAPVDEATKQKLSAELPKNISTCELIKKFGEVMKLPKFDKSSFKTYLKNGINDSVWEPIFEKSSDFCFDLIPKYLEIYSKRMELEKEECNAKLLFQMECLVMIAYLDCPANKTTKFTETTECAELKSTIKECSENPEVLAKAAESYQGKE